MTTFSFDFKHTTAESNDAFDPSVTYAISLHCEAGRATRSELDTVMSNTAAATLRLRFSRAPLNEKFHVNKEQGNFDHLRFDHYTWHVVRSDGRPMNASELQFAFLTHSMKGEETPLISMPYTTLNALLTADKTLSQAFAAALSGAEIGQHYVDIQEPEIATGLLALGVIGATLTNGKYALMDVAVIG